MDFLQTFVEEAAEILAMWEELLLEYDHSNPEEAVANLFRYAHSLKGSSKSVGLDHIGSFVHRVEDHLKTLQAEPTRFGTEDIDILMMVHQVISKAMQHEAFQVLESDDTRTVENYLSNQSSYSKSAQLPQESFGFFDTNDNKTQAFEIFSDSEVPENKNSAPTTLNTKNKNSGTESIKIRTDKIEQITRIYGELKISVEGLERLIEKKDCSKNEYIKSIKNLRRIQMEIEQPIMSLNLESIKPVLLKLKKVGSDVAKKLNKKINFKIIGEDVELDKKVHNRIKEPLEHIIRNAVDHGIEILEERIKTSKDPTATIIIAATNQGSSIEIEIKDDGGGIKKGRVIQKAIDNKIATADEISKMSDNQINKLILMPGFSTAEKVTDVSGRGVGMDIVHTTVKQLDGEIDIESDEGVGTNFKISIPSNFSLQDVFIIEGKSNTLCILASQVEKMFTVDKSTKNSHFITHNKHLWSPISLTDIMKNKSLFEYPEFHGLILSGVHSYYLVSPKITRRQSIVYKKIDTRVSHNDLYKGTTILDNGEPSLIIDAQKLLDQATQMESSA